MKWKLLCQLKREAVSKFSFRLGIQRWNFMLQVNLNYLLWWSVLLWGFVCMFDIIRLDFLCCFCTAKAVYSIAIPTFPFIWCSVVKVTDKVCVLPGKSWFCLPERVPTDCYSLICFLRPPVDFILIIRLSSHPISSQLRICACLSIRMCLFQLF